MTVPTNDNQVQEQTKENSKEYNFRAIEARLQQERAARLEAERRAEEALKQLESRNVQHDDEDDDSDIVDRRKLNKTLAKFGEQTQKVTQSEINKAVAIALQEERKQNWLKSNNDFYDVLSKYADKLHQHDPELAESILEMPDTFERQKLVYKNIKSLGLHRDAPREPTIQEKVDANKRSPYYQPSGVGTSPYAQVGDFSQSGQKNAYEKMQALKKQLRI